LKEGIPVNEHAAKVVLITGANRGIGLEVAKQLAKRDFHVVVAARDAGGGNKTATEIQASGGKASFLAIEVAVSESIRTAAKTFGDRFAALDVLINNAGVYLDKEANVLKAPRTLFEQTFAINTFGALEVTQAFLPFLRKAVAARVINVSSGYGQLDGMAPEVPSYCLSKLALNGVTIQLAQALRSEQIAVNSMCPGWVRTDMGGANAPRSVEQGADTAVWLAAEAPHDKTGLFFRDRKEISY
jgi:NAD(P)-dependent dehydrogenase (short-subunit alcohol dehydrogenase family)